MAATTSGAHALYINFHFADAIIVIVSNLFWILRGLLSHAFDPHLVRPCREVNQLSHAECLPKVVVHARDVP